MKHFAKYVFSALATGAVFTFSAHRAGAKVVAARHHAHPFAVASPPARNLLTTQYFNNVPTVTLRGPQLSVVATSLLPFESLDYYRTIGGFSIASVAPVVGGAYDTARCTVSFDHALCTDTAPRSNAAIDILGDPNSNFVRNYRTFKVNFKARDPLANGSIYGTVGIFALSIVFADNASPSGSTRSYVGWLPQP